MYNNIRRGDEKWRLGVTPLSEQSENTTGTSDFSPNYSGTFSQQVQIHRIRAKESAVIWNNR